MKKIEGFLFIIHNLNHNKEILGERERERESERDYNGNRFYLSMRDRNRGLIEQTKLVLAGMGMMGFKFVGLGFSFTRDSNGNDGF